MKFATKAIHAGNKPDSATGSISTPIYQTSTFVQEDLGEHKGFTYSRLKNPTRLALEKNLAAIENGQYAFCFSSGMAAIEAAAKLLKPGDEALVSEDLYGGTSRFFTRIFSEYGVKFHFIPFGDLEVVEKQINDNTKCLWIETPTNPVVKIFDIKAIAALARKRHLFLCVDNTFATPYLQNPLDLGAHVVVHSATKYLGGHSDVVLGGVVCNDETIAERIYAVQSICGAIPGPQDCFLVLRGIKSLHVRMKAHCENAAVVAQMLKQHPAVNHVYWPGFTGSKDYEIARSQMLNFGGMVAFDLKDDTIETARQVMNRTAIFCIAESLGGVESIMSHPVTMSHAGLEEADRKRLGVTDSLIRLSVGIEDPQDLVDDLKMALDF